VWFEWDGTHLSFSQTTGRQKYRNVRKDPHVALSIVDPENPYRYLEVRGVVDRIDDDPDYEFIDRQAQRYIEEEKYPWHQPGDERVVVRVRPVHTSQMG
jgi:PPOX class probable F420-dependent enzyme